MFPPLRFLSLFFVHVFYVTSTRFSADKSTSNSSLVRTSVRKLDLKTRQSWLFVSRMPVMTRDSTYLCVKIKHLAKDYVKNGKSGRRVVVAKADHSMDAYLYPLSSSFSEIYRPTFISHSLRIPWPAHTCYNLSTIETWPATSSWLLPRHGALSFMQIDPPVRSIGSPILHQPDTATTYVCIFLT